MYSAKPDDGMWKLKQRAECIAVVVEAVDDVGRNERERSCRKGPRAVAEVERELPLDDEKAIRVAVVDVRLRSALTRAVGELGDDDLFVSTSIVARRSGRRFVIVLSLRSSGLPDDDEPGIGRNRIRRRPLVERGHVPTDVVAVARARSVEDEKSRRDVAGHLDCVHDLGRDEGPALGADPMYAILELERELSLEHVQRLAVPGMDVRRFTSGATSTPMPRMSARDLDRGELLATSARSVTSSASRFAG